MNESTTPEVSSVSLETELIPNNPIRGIGRPAKGSSGLRLFGDALHDDRLGANERECLSLLIYRSKLTGYCWASNASLSDSIGKAPRTVGEYLTLLERTGYIQRELRQDPKVKGNWKVERRIRVNPDILRQNKVKLPEGIDAAFKYSREETAGYPGGFKQYVKDKLKESRVSRQASKRKSKSYTARVAKNKREESFRKTEFFSAPGASGIPPRNLGLRKDPSPEGSEVEAVASFSEPECNAVLGDEENAPGSLHYPHCPAALEAFPITPGQNQEIPPASRVGAFVILGCRSQEVARQVLNTVNDTTAPGEVALLGTHDPGAGKARIRRDAAEFLDATIATSGFALRKHLAEHPEIQPAIRNASRNPGQHRLALVAFGVPPEELEADNGFWRKVTRLQRMGLLQDHHVDDIMGGRDGHFQWYQRDEVLRRLERPLRDKARRERLDRGTADYLPGMRRSFNEVCQAEKEVEEQQWMEMAYREFAPTVDDLDSIQGSWRKDVSISAFPGEQVGFLGVLAGVVTRARHGCVKSAELLAAVVAVRGPSTARELVRSAYWREVICRDNRLFEEMTGLSSDDLSTRMLDEAASLHRQLVEAGYRGIPVIEALAGRRV